MKPYQLKSEEVIAQLQSNAVSGLTREQVAQRLRAYGSNILTGPAPDSGFIIFIRQFKSPLVYILLGAALLIFITGERLDAFIISGILLFNAIVGAVQEGRTRTILESLKQYITAETIVIRDGVRQIIDAKFLVPGDIIIVQEGEKVPADARIIQAHDLVVDEAMLTGESIGVHKQSAALPSELSVQNQKNMIFCGTYVLSGNAQAVVVAIGKETQVGALQKAIETIETDLPLKVELDRLSHLILLFITVQCIFLFIVGVWFGRPIPQLLVFLAALFVCVIPEGIPVVFTIALVSSARRMAQKNVLVKRLQAVQALGLTDVIIIDKTGTVTRNELVVTDLFANGLHMRVTGEGYSPEGALFINDTQISPEQHAQLHDFADAAILLNQSQVAYDVKRNLYKVKGDPTDVALAVCAQKIGARTQGVEKRYRLMELLPFNTTVRYKAGLYEHAGVCTAFIIGSPEVILSGSQTSPELQDALTDFLARGLRVIAIAKKELGSCAGGCLTQERIAQELTTGLTFLGLVGMQDALRTDIADVITQARNAGLHIVMATGDHHDTALNIAKQVGIFREHDNAIDGTVFDTLSDQELRALVPNTTVFSRVTPQQKLRIVKLFQDQGIIVAMTGDGVNDAPSLVAADLGIAMGAIGTEVAKSASDMILLDDSFASIIQAIQEGRHIFLTLRRVVLYFFATNGAEIIMIIIALMTNMPLPLFAAQILWLNLVTDGFLDVALSAEAQEVDLLQPNVVLKLRHLIDFSLMFKALYMALPMGIGSMLVFVHYYQRDAVYARTMTLLTMAFFQWFNAWNCRSEMRSLFQIGLFTNRWLLLATVVVFVMQIGVVYLPIMHVIFRTVSIGFAQWIFILLFTSSIVFIEEIRKLIARHLDI